jgi:predicted metalloprotease with PDZ domain
VNDGAPTDFDAALADHAAPCPRRRRLIAALTCAIAGTPRAFAAAPSLSTTAIYRVSVLGISPPRFAVAAVLPIDGDRLDVVEDYPAELPEMEAKGWPALISHVEVRDADGAPVGVVAARKNGWTLGRRVSGRVHVDYVVDFALFAAAHWPSPLESAFADDEHVAVAGRPLFIVTTKVADAQVAFDVPARWRVVAPWPAGGGGREYRVASAADLTGNMLVFSTVEPDIAVAAGFRLQIVAMGHWKPLRPLLRRVLQTIIAREVALMAYDAHETYNVVLLPIDDTGGAAYRQSFAYCFEHPTADNRAIWANTLAHEIFHYWNYARLHGADYASTQWFQEGFTEYVANLVLVEGGIVDEPVFLAKLGQHMRNYRKLTTTLEAIGTHKGPPLYSAGALVAFSFDVMIRAASGGSRDLGTFFRQLWKATDAGARRYAWPDIRDALAACADLDWQGFYEAHIRGAEPLPLDRALSLAGLRLDGGTDTVLVDPAATDAAKAVRRNLVSGRR